MKPDDKKKQLKQKSLGKKGDSGKRDVPTGNYWMWFALAGVLLATFAIYFKAIRFEALYTWDDNLYVSENPDIRLLNWVSVKTLFTSFYVGNYQPLTMLLYALEYKLGSGSASLFHFTSILLHLFNTCLVFVLIRKISPSGAVTALITAAFFAVHPLHVESVAWISERKDVLYSFFFLLSLIQYVTYRSSGKQKHLYFALVFFLLSCLSKSAAVVLPVLFLLFDYYSNRKLSLKMILEKIPFFILSLIFGIVAIYSQGKAAQLMTPKMTFLEHTAVVCQSTLSYLFKAILPIRLSAIYPYPVELGNTALPLWYYLSIPAVLLFIVGIVYSRKWGKDIVFGFGFFIIAILLELQIVSIGRAPMADRYSYIPYIGLFFLFGKLCEHLSEKLKFKSFQFYKRLWLVPLFGFIAFTVIANNRIEAWENDEVLFKDVLTKYPYEITSNLNTGFYYMDYCSLKKVNSGSESEQYLYKALDCFNSVLEHDSTIYRSYYNYDKTLCDTWYNIGITKAALNDHPGAIQSYSVSIKLNPGNSSAFNNRGSEKMKLDDYPGAIRDFDKASALSPKTDYIYFNRAKAKVRINDLTGALQDYNTTLALTPAYANAYSGRAYIKYRMKDLEGASNDYGKAITLNPQDQESVKNREILISILEKAKKH